MVLFRTPLVDKNQPIVILDGPNAGCLTPYFQRTLLDITGGSNAGSQASSDFAPQFALKVDKHGSTAWTAPTGTASKATFATYAAPTISNPPTQVEVQAIADHVQILSQHVKALIDGLITAAVFN